MAGTFVNNGLVDLAEGVRSKLNTYTLHLYSNNHTPAQGDAVGAYMETVGTGYAAQAITSFGAGFLNGSNEGETDSAAFNFTPTGSAVPWTVYGFYITDGGGLLVGAWKDPNGPYTLTASNQTYSVTISALVIAA